MSTIDQGAIDRFWPKVAKGGDKDCWTWLRGRTHDGYGIFKVGTTAIIASRVAWMIARGPVPDGLVVCHTCDNRLCVNVEHMFVGTRADNNNDRHAKGRSARGESSGPKRHPETIARGVRKALAKLDDDKVRIMRAMRRNGVTVAEIARTFGVARSAASVAVNGKTWRHVI
jgi:hypothetical protein